MTSQYLNTHHHVPCYYVPTAHTNNAFSLSSLLSKSLKASFQTFCTLSLSKQHQKTQHEDPQLQTSLKTIQVIEISSENEELQHNKNQQQICNKIITPNADPILHTGEKSAPSDHSNPSSPIINHQLPVCQISPLEVEELNQNPIIPENLENYCPTEEMDLTIEPIRVAFSSMQKRIKKKKMCLLSRKVNEWDLISKRYRQQRREIRMLNN